MCNGIAIIAMPTPDGLKVFCDNDNGSHDTLLHKYVPVEQHNSIIKVEYIFPGEMRLDCPDEACRTAALDTGLVEVAFGNVLRLTSSAVSEIARQMPTVAEWPKSLMQEANLEGANLRLANLTGANLVGANLYRANLEGANLAETNLRWANLQWANLEGANLEGANLAETNLRWANLQWANLEGANLTGADLEGADLIGANLRGAIGLPEEEKQ